MFQGLGRNGSRLNIDEGMTRNSLEVDASYACSLLERSADRAVDLRAGRACEHKRDPLLRCEGVAGEEEYKPDQERAWGKGVRHRMSNDPGQLRLVQREPAGFCRPRQNLLCGQLPGHHRHEGHRLGIGRGQEHRDRSAKGSGQRMRHQRIGSG